MKPSSQARSPSSQLALQLSSRHLRRLAPEQRATAVRLLATLLLEATSKAYTEVTDDHPK
ncbi:MAG: hypothetical protein GY946_32930 [bacterium]|nr:hypothetical protein [bacterium]